MSLKTISIIGASQAGLQTAQSLRQFGFDGEINLIGDEKYAPYQRPPLSKSYLLGKTTKEALFFRNADFYKDNEINLILSTKVNNIDIKSKTLTLNNDKKLSFDGLALTLGATNIKPKIKGINSNSIYYLRTLDDISSIQNNLPNSENITILGGGFVGLEFAAICSKMAKKVTLIEAQNRLMKRSVSVKISNFFDEIHNSNNVNIIYNTKIINILSDTKNQNKIKHVELDNHELIPTDLLLIGVGAKANYKLAENAGINCNHAIITDSYCKTNIENIVAAGDCTISPQSFNNNSLMRLESVQNAIDQAKIAAASLLGNKKVNNALPWFWSDQYQYKLQTAGIISDYDKTSIRGDSNQASFSAFHFKADKLQAVESINKPADHMIAKILLTKQINITPNQVEDFNFNLKSLI